MGGKKDSNAAPACTSVAGCSPGEGGGGICSTDKRSAHCITFTVKKNSVITQ